MMMLCAQVLNEQEFAPREGLVLLAAEDLKEMQVTVGARRKLQTAIKSLLMRPEEVEERAEFDQRVQKLKEWGLEDTTDTLTSLTRERYKSLRRLRKLDGEPEDITRELKDPGQAVKTEELQLPPAAGAVAQEEAAAKKTAVEEAKKKGRGGGD
jgi:peptidoglycan hydrolase CwlO-like protein